MSRLGFQLEREAPGSRARAARFRTLHRAVSTPLFMPVGTRATVKGFTAAELDDLGSQVLLANTYHLLLRPGAEVFERLGGIHRFMGWPGAVLTDSGGFQIYSLPHGRKLGEAGAAFKSYVDGRTVLLSPETSIATQRAIGSDIMMALDECVPSTSERSVAEAAVGLTTRWAKRSLAARGDSPQALFGIVQGALFPELRRRSADELTAMPFDGFAVGGLAVGETKAQREDFTELTTELLPRELPRYLMGVGTPLDLLEGVHRGIDMFDCILPQAHAQHGTAYTWNGLVRLRRTAERLVEAPIDPACACRVCLAHSRAYLHHLLKAEEGLGWRLIAHHNVHFFHRLMASMREAILTGGFEAFYRQRRETLALVDGAPATPPPKPRAARQAPAMLGCFQLAIDEGGTARIRARDAAIADGAAIAAWPEAAPDEVARRLCVEEARLAERLREESPRPLVVWDVGLGAAHRAMAAIACAEAELAAGKLRRPLALLSFDRDLDALRLALANIRCFPHLRHAAPHRLARDGSWRRGDGAIVWTLCAGDVLAALEAAEAPDLAFLEPAWREAGAVSAALAQRTAVGMALIPAAPISPASAAPHPAPAAAAAAPAATDCAGRSRRPRSAPPRRWRQPEA